MYSITHKELECNKKMPRILEFSRKISIFIAEKISLCEGEKEKDLARKTVNSNDLSPSLIVVIEQKEYNIYN